ncbi:MAG TPA: tetratricopeptide repeat protein, partial [Candidatus Kapabacteria bacterium]
PEPEGIRSPAFNAPFEERTENALDIFRHAHLESYSSDALEQLNEAETRNYALNEHLLTLDLFRSLAAYYRRLEFSAESRIDNILSNTPAGSRTATNAALAGALEFYSRTPLTRKDVEGGIARLDRIETASASAAAVQPEIDFWKSEGYRALGENAQAEQNYHAAVEKSSDPRLAALTYFHLAELFEREERFPDADTNFAKASRIRESPLALLALLRLGAVERSERNFTGVLATMDEAEKRFHATEHRIRTSARNLDYTSPLIEELLLRSTEEDRILGRGTMESVHYDSVPELISPFYLSEVQLLRGSALSSLGKSTEATDVLQKGETLIDGAVDSSNDPLTREQARFVSDALRFERGWSLFQQGQYKDAAAVFLELAVSDTSREQYALLEESTLPLRAQGDYFDPYLNDTALSGSLANGNKIPIVRRSVIEKDAIDTSFFLYNDFPERARYYAGVSLARAGLLEEAAQTLQKLALAPSMLYSDQALYQLALIRFEEHSYEAQKLLEPASEQPSVRGAYASFLLGELAYRRNDYERAERYFLNAFAYLPPQDTSVSAAAHLERGLSLVPLGNWTEAAQELETYLNESHEHIPGRTDEALFWMGKAYFRAMNYDSAIATFSRLIAEYPTSTRMEDAQYNYAWSLFEANDFAQAEPAFQKVLAIDTISRYAYDALEHAGDAEYAMGMTKHANTLYNRATDRPGFNPFRITRATLMMGITRMKIDSERSAMNAFEYIGRKFPESDIVDLADFNYALSAYAINLSSAAEEMVSTIREKYGKSSVAPRALYVAGEERVRHGDERGALHYYQNVIASYANSPEAGPALFALQDALADLKRIPEAMAVADTFVSNNPNNPISPMVLLRAGEFQMKLDQPDAAVGTFRSFLTRYPSNPARPHAELLLGESELATGDTESGILQLDTVTHRYDSLSEAASAWLDLAQFERVRGNTDSAATDFQQAYQDRYYSYDAAPDAMYFYGEMLADRRRNDSAIAVLLDLSNRYPIEASISARGAIKAGELLAADEQFDSARRVFRSVMDSHSKDVFGGTAAVQSAGTYLMESNWAKAASDLTTAKRDFPLTMQSEGICLFGLARANVHLGKKAEAIRDLHAMLALRGTLASERSSALTLLDTLQPPQKQKAKKGKKK